VQRGGLGIFFGALGHPPLGFAQIPAAKKEAAVLFPLLPLRGTRQQPRMGLFPIQVGIERGDDLRKFSVKVVAPSEVDPLVLGDYLRDSLVRDGFIEYRNYPFVESAA